MDAFSLAKFTLIWDTPGILVSTFSIVAVHEAQAISAMWIWAFSDFLGLDFPTIPSLLEPASLFFILLLLILSLGCELCHCFFASISLNIPNPRSVTFPTLSPLLMTFSTVRRLMFGPIMCTTAGLAKFISQTRTRLALRIRSSKSTLPLGLHTRSTSMRPCTGSGTEQNTKESATVSKVLSSNWRF